MADSRILLHRSDNQPLSDRHGGVLVVERLESAGMGELFKQGLHEFVSDALAVTARLSREIKEAYHF